MFVRRVAKCSRNDGRSLKILHVNIRYANFSIARQEPTTLLQEDGPLSSPPHSHVLQRFFLCEFPTHVLYSILICFKSACSSFECVPFIFQLCPQVKSINFVLFVFQLLYRTSYSSFPSRFYFTSLIIFLSFLLITSIHFSPSTILVSLFVSSLSPPFLHSLLLFTLFIYFFSPSSFSFSTLPSLLPLFSLHLPPNLPSTIKLPSLFRPPILTLCNFLILHRSLHALSTVISPLFLLFFLYLPPNLPHCLSTQSFSTYFFQPSTPHPFPFAPL